MDIVLKEALSVTMPELYLFDWRCDTLNTIPDMSCSDWESPFQPSKWYTGAPYDWGAWDRWSDCMNWIDQGLCVGVGPYNYNPGKNCNEEDPCLGYRT